MPTPEQVMIHRKDIHEDGKVELISTDGSNQVIRRYSVDAKEIVSQGGWRLKNPTIVQQYEKKEPVKANESTANADIQTEPVEEPVAQQNSRDLGEGFSYELPSSAPRIQES
jgi:hypothetical protein